MQKVGDNQSGADVSPQWRLLWILYADANSRFDTLIEECAHLQDTIRGLIRRHDIADEFLNNEELRVSDADAGFQRPILRQFRDYGNFHDAPSADQAYLCLWNFLGGLIYGLIANQNSHLDAFQKCLARLQINKGGLINSEDLYWYIATRGYFLKDTFGFYTDQIEHAHEKLVQMLENQVSIPPAPLLFRRWNSAAYGEFLSEYSRQVNWEARTLVKNIRNDVFTATEDEHCGSEKKHNNKAASMTHTWTHHPSSLTKRFTINLENIDGKSGVEQRYAIVQSAYFYLEQPILFPLLYHECVHVNFPKDDITKLEKNNFFRARLAVVESLRRAEFPGAPNVTNDQFWNHFTEEVWADTMSLALGGRAYLMPLALQVFGDNSGSEFTHYQINEDSPYPIDQWGRVNYRKYEVQYPELSEAFFWEARLLVSCRVLRAFGRHKRGVKAAESRDDEIYTAVENLIDAWWESGAQAFRDDQTSPEHANYWTYRREINEWVAETLLRSLVDHLPELHGRADICSTYHIRPSVDEPSDESNGVANLINTNFSAYAQKNLGPGGSETELVLEKAGVHRLENVAVDAKWIASSRIARQLIDMEAAEHWARNFASWVPNEGCVPYRIALEASRVKMSLFDSLADMLDAQESSISATVDRQPGIDAGWVKKRLEIFASRIPKNLKKDSEFRRKLLRRRGLTASDMVEHRCVDEVRFLGKLLNELEVLTDDIMRLSSQAGDAGTLTLGVIRPAEFIRRGNEQSNDSPYAGAFRRVRESFEAAAKGHDKMAGGRTDSKLSKDKARGAVTSLIGEYQFMSYAPDSTPVERDFHPDGAPLMLIKPRFVVHIGGLPLCDLLKVHNGSWGRVSLIRFKYKYQWCHLLRRLECGLRASDGKVARNVYSLYLSSAWEHVVLVTMHELPRDAWRLDKLGLVAGNCSGVDIQSTYIVPDDVLNSNKNNNPLNSYSTSQGAVNAGEGWIGKFAAWAEASDLVSLVYKRSGRFDYTVIWKNSGEKKEGWELKACVDGLAKMPSHLWQNITAMLSSFEERSYEHKDSISINRHDYVAVTHFAVSDRRTAADSE